MASEGWNSPSTIVDDGSYGTLTWSNPGNAGASDNSDASVAFSGSGISHYLKATNFGFSIPSDSTIDGIVVEIERAASTTNRISDSRVRIVKGGTIGSTDKAATSTYYPTSDAYASYGGNSDLWGETWSYTDINATNFGVVLSCGNIVGTQTGYVDHIRITVYYTEGGGGGDAMPMAQTMYARRRNI